MIEVKYPEPAFRMKKENETDFIFDNLRKQWLVLTEEEWVRQNFVQYLVQSLQIPASYMAIEKEIMLGELKKRFDILVFDKDHKPWMMVECKASAIPLTEDVLQQVLRYNITVPVQFMIITNGHYTYGWERSEKGLVLIKKLPAW